jgi:uncharacterized lipoprotein YmbA
MLALVVLGAGGCLSVSPPPRSYLLFAVPPQPANSTSAVVVGVGPVSIPAYLDRSSIVTRGGDGEVTLSGEHRWAEPLRDGIAQTLAENLAAMLPSDAVPVFPWRTPWIVQYRVTVDILRFDGALGGLSVLDARWRLLDGTGKQLVLRAVHLQETATETTYSALVSAHSRLLAHLSQDIAAEIRSRVR